jgi:hypothetical protein
LGISYARNADGRGVSQAVYFFPLFRAVKINKIIYSRNGKRNAVRSVLRRDCAKRSPLAFVDYIQCKFFVHFSVFSSHIIFLLLSEYFNSGDSSQRFFIDLVFAVDVDKSLGEGGCFQVVLKSFDSPIYIYMSVAYSAEKGYSSRFIFIGLINIVSV